LSDTINEFNASATFPEFSKTETEMQNFLLIFLGVG
jgi:hypothetical protein